MLKKDARKIAHTLSKPSKMPCASYSLPIEACKTGGKLRNICGSVCSICYAGRGCYGWSSTVAAMARRLESIQHPLWVRSMVTLIRGSEYFRWHDSGDLQGPEHLQAIISIAEALPGTRFWLPTKEYWLARHAPALPDNLTMRVSSPMVDQKPLHWAQHTSTAHKDKDPIGFRCPAYDREPHQCGSCRACWDRSIPNVSYPAH